MRLDIRNVFRTLGTVYQGQLQGQIQAQQEQQQRQIQLLQTLHGYQQEEEARRQSTLGELGRQIPNVPAEQQGGLLSGVLSGLAASPDPNAPGQPNDAYRAYGFQPPPGGWNAGYPSAMPSPGPVTPPPAASAPAPPPVAGPVNPFEAGAEGQGVPPAPPAPAPEPQPAGSTLTAPYGLGSYPYETYDTKLAAKLPDQMTRALASLQKADRTDPQAQIAIQGLMDQMPQGSIRGNKDIQDRQNWIAKVYASPYTQSYQVGAAAARTEGAKAKRTGENILSLSRLAKLLTPHELSDPEYVAKVAQQLHVALPEGTSLGGDYWEKLRTELLKGDLSAKTDEQAKVWFDAAHDYYITTGHPLRMPREVYGKLSPAKKAMADAVAGQQAISWANVVTGQKRANIDQQRADQAAGGAGAGKGGKGRTLTPNEEIGTLNGRIRDQRKKMELFLRSGTPKYSEADFLNPNPDADFRPPPEKQKYFWALHGQIAALDEERRRRVQGFVNQRENPAPSRPGAAAGASTPPQGSYARGGAAPGLRRVGGPLPGTPTPEQKIRTVMDEKHWPRPQAVQWLRTHGFLPAGRP